MKPLLTALSLLSLAFVSCEKVRNLASKASSAATGKTAEGDSKVDAGLQKLVDQTPEGAVFRKDLPFPARLEVRTTFREEMSVRFSQSSAIEKRADVLKGTRLTITKLEYTGTRFRHTLEQSSFSIPSPDNPKEMKEIPADTLNQVAPSKQSIAFRKTGNLWKSDEQSEFRAVVLSRQLAPVIEQLVIENALVPRPQWFAKRRIKVGEQFVVSGSSLPMLLAGNAKGSITLKLESFEPVEGHPCGVFSISGDYSRKQFPDFSGNLTDEDVTIQSGKIWLSLIYPVILREEMDNIRTFKSGGQGGLVGHGQGTVKVSLKRTWKPLGAP